MAERLIITNGDSAAEGLRAAGIAAQVLPWRDMLHDGPVPAGLALEALSEVRARYLAEEFALAGADVGRDFAARDATIRSHAEHDRIELWFEHDLYDQLQLIQILDALSGLGREDGLLLLVQAVDYLGPMSAESLHALDGTARPVTPAQIAAARSAWAAFTQATPEGLAALAATDRLSLPFLPAALGRLVAELPHMRSGLSLTEERILSVLADGPRNPGLLFNATQDQEQARFLGDASFFRRLDGLAFCPIPLVDGLPFRSRRCTQGAADYRAFTQSTITLTEAGRAALTGAFDHARQNGIDRWLGGTHLTPQNLWRRDSRGVVAPLQ
jgi:Domain of unknown function (DUF1835)